MKEIAPKKNLENELIEHTKALIQSIKRNYLAISVNVFKMHEMWTGTVDEWVNFYGQELELGKSQVSKMLKVGSFLLMHRLTQATAEGGVGYEALYLSINRNPDADPRHILAEAQTWSKADYKDQAKADCKTPEFGLYCKHCWATKEKHV